MNKMKKSGHIVSCLSVRHEAHLVFMIIVNHITLSKVSSEFLFFSKCHGVTGWRMQRKKKCKSRLWRLASMAICPLSGTGHFAAIKEAICKEIASGLL